MFSEEFELYFVKACRSAFEASLPSSYQWHVEKNAMDNVHNFPSFVLITIGGHRFRTLSALHFDTTESVKELAAKALGIKSIESLTEEQLQDFLCEMMNTLIGSFKRDLQNQILSLGMSTPSILESNCIKFVEAIKPAHQVCFKATAQGKTLFAASFHTSLYGDLELTQADAEDESEAGGLEFF